MSAPSANFTPELVAQVKRARFNPIRTLTPEVLANQLDAFAAGYLRDFAISGEAIKRRDDVVSVALPKREMAVSRRDLAVNITDGLPEAKKPRAEQHRAALKYFWDNCTVSHVLERDVRGGSKLLVRQMMSAIGARYAVHEIVWQPRVVEGRDQLTATFHFVPLQFFEATTGKLRFLRNYLGSIYGEDMAAGEWLVTVGPGILEPLSVGWMFKQLSLKDWVSYNESAGTPFRLGKTRAAKGSAEWQVLVDALEEMGQDFSAVVNEGSEISFVGAPNQATIPFPALCERMDRAIATICRGADLSTMSAGQGEGQGASLQGNEGDLLEQDDAELISETLAQVSRRVIDYLFGEEPLAYAQIVVPARKDNADARANITLAVQHGIPVGQAWVRDQLGLAAPAAGEELLRAALPQATPFGGGFTAANAAPAAREALFRAAALKSLSAAQAAALRPLVVRILAVADEEDAAKFDAALTRLRAELPQIAAEVLRGDATGELAKAWENILGPALVSGAAEAAQARKP